MGSDAIQNAIDYGIDLSLTEENLRRTPEERLIQHQKALNLLEEIIKAKLTSRHAGSEQSS